MTDDFKENEKRDSRPEINRIIHEPARLIILSYLYVVESADFLFLERQTGLTRGNLSSHLSKLEAAGYVQIKKEFVDKTPHTLIKLSLEGREAFKVYKKSMKEVLDDLPD
jgi:DNA-binding MarR family transcriptional regulator